MGNSFDHLVWLFRNELAPARRSSGAGIPTQSIHHDRVIGSCGRRVELGAAFDRAQRFVRSAADEQNRSGVRSAHMPCQHDALVETGDIEEQFVLLGGMAEKL